MTPSQSFFVKPVLALVLLLAACGDFAGGDADARVAVPPSYATYLPTSAARQFSQVIATALRAQDLRAVADPAGPTDWQVRLGAIQAAGMVTPIFSLIDPDGNERGRVQGRAVPSVTWRRAQAENLRQAAVDMAPRLAAAFKRAAADRLQSADRALQERQRQARLNAQPNRPMRVVIVGSVGAPTDGNNVLRQLMTEKLTRLGEAMQESETGADFTVRAKVDDVSVDEKTRRIEIFWLLRNANNQEVGEIVQLQEIPAGSLDRGWGNLAVTVTDEAAGAIHDVILTQLGRR